MSSTNCETMTAGPLPGKSLFKPFVSPSRGKSKHIPTRSGNKRTELKRSNHSVTLSQRVNALKRRKISTPKEEDEKESSSDDGPCLPGINYNGMPKNLFKPFRPPKSSAKTKSDDHPDADNVRTAGGGTLGIRRRLAKPKGPRYNPDTEDAVVLYRPPEPKSKLKELEYVEVVIEPRALIRSPSSTSSSGSATAVNTPRLQQFQRNKTLKSLLGGGDEAEEKRVPVVVDPAIGRKLRPHQVEGVHFMYKCVTGQVYPNAFGCIMADEMGLGKTMQCIALLWTLLQQSPIPGKPTIEKCIVACPSSLVKNWANELVKWLGSTKISPLACDNKGSKEKVQASLRQFISAHGRMVFHPVLIISYETLRTNIKILGSGPVGMLLCDEGHRLKNSQSQTFQALNSLQVERRIILSGTPIQNDLTEYFSLLNFTNPGLLGTPQEFRKTYELPILKGRDALATSGEQEKGDSRLSELNAIASRVIIRRTNDLLTKYLPTKYEHVVFCPLTEFQTDLYELFLKSKAAREAIGEGGKCSLQTIINLGKLCNHPSIMDIKQSVDGYEKVTPDGYFTESIKSAGRTGGSGRRMAAIASMNRQQQSSSSGMGRAFHPKWSSKMVLLDRMLQKIHKGSEKDKIVLISNYTKTLDAFEAMCTARGFGYYRLDGAMSIPKRQQIVDRFNDPRDSAFVFLLSSKAGGCGINLVGANRLILFDSSFNPAENLQACGRIWRDGQKKTCYIYTFVTTGTVEEKIFQRQSYKTSLSSCVIDEQENVERHFSRDEMRQLFKAKLRDQTMSETHDQFKCKRCVGGHQAIKAPEPMEFTDHNTWDHFSKHESHKLQDHLLKLCMGKDVSFVFQYKSHNQ